MGTLCGPSPVWDNDLTLNADHPDLTPCFQNTVLLWIPSFFLVIFTPIRILQLRESVRTRIPLTWLNITKTVLGVLLGILALGELFYSIGNSSNEDIPAMYFVSPCIVFLAMILAIIVIQYERLKGVCSSGVMCVYWFLWTVADSLICASKMRYVSFEGSTENKFRFIVFLLHFGLVIAQLVFAVLVDRHPGLEKKDQNMCPEENASFLSRMTFWWFTSLIIKGYKNPLVKEDLWQLNKQDRSESVVAKFEKQWEKEVMKKKLSQERSNENGTDIPLQPRGEDPTEYVVTDQTSYQPSLLKALFRTFGWTFLGSVCYKLAQDILIFISPQLLKSLIAFTGDKSDPEWKGYVYAVSLFIVAFTQSVIVHQYFHICMVVGMKLRTTIVAAVYKKALLLTNESRKASTVGEIVNLMSTDAQRFMDLCTHLNLIWSAPFQIALSLYFLWQTLGPSVLAGLGIMILLIPVNMVIANKTKALQIEQMKYKDWRVKLMNEVLNGIKVLKLYAWEVSFKEKILGIRNMELQVLKKTAYLNAASSFTFACAPFFVSLTTFGVYVLSSDDHILDAEKAFVSLSLFNILRFPLSFLPTLMSNMVQANVSLQRLTRFLNHEELDPSSISRIDSEGNALRVQSGTFTWEKDEKPVLKNINISVAPWSLIAVVGQVGSGKSSLLSALLGDVEKLEGKVSLVGSVSYVPQQAWIQNGSLQDNILFGKPIEDAQYDAVIQACALVPDLEILPARDKTEIGEKGINLSGGQKQRVSLARAVYNDSDVYLLDDPLSAVDSHVGKHIFQEVIGPTGLLKNKTRILVTHGITHLPKVDQIIMLDEGSVIEMGTYEELTSRQGPFAEFLKNIGQKEDSDEEEEMEKQPSRPASLLSLSGSKMISSSVGSVASREGSTSSIGVGSQEEETSSLLLGSQTQLNSEMTDTGADEKTENHDKAKLVQAETAQTGRVTLEVCLAYLKFIGNIVSVIIFLLYGFNIAVSIYSNVWLSEWSNDANKANGTLDTAKRDMRLGVYGALGVAQGLFILFAAFSLTRGALRAANYLHSGILTSILRSPMGFFDRTPTGRIMNRFSKDVDVLDSLLPQKMRAFLNNFSTVLSTILVVSYTTPWFLIAAVPLAILYYFVQRFYVATSRQLKRLESVTRSPIYSHFGESIQGASVIRAYGQQQRFILESAQRVDDNQVCYFPNIVSNRWLVMRLEFFGNCIVFFAALFAVIGRETLSPGIIGLSVSYALSVTSALTCLVRNTSDLETNVVAVERIKEYTEIPSEAEWEIPEVRPPKEWPQEGKIIIDNYSTQYHESLDLVVKGINCSIRGGEKIGIVGRTGAGKSSLTLGLFRIIEPTSGTINIDGVDVTKIGLHDLRSKLTVIPQDPVLFSATLRTNLDPFDQYSDDVIWKALEHAHIKAYVSGLAEGLLHECTEGGGNLSVGQRQLICLARALLRKTKILVLDEATAAVDLETDDLIQSTIRTEFEGCTVITIAHRINTVLDYDRILVLDAGEIREFASPKELLQEPKSLFHSLVKDAGITAQV